MKDSKEHSESIQYFYYNKRSEQELRNFIEKNFSKIYRKSWCTLSRDRSLSEPFIKEFQDQLDWWWISQCQTLSEDFIREFQDKLDWYWVSQFQKLSEQFLIEFIDRIDTYLLKYNEKIPEDVKQRVIDLKKVIDQ